MVFNRKFIRKVGPWRWAWRTAVRQFYKRVLNRPMTVRLPTGMEYRVHPWDPHGAEVFVTGADTDMGAEAMFYRLVRPEGLFVDVGAHAGYYALYLYPKCAEVHAFDTDATSVACLSGYGLARLVVHRAAVGRRSSGGIGIRSVGGGFSYVAADGPSEAVDAVCLDDRMRNRRTAVTGIKVDIDGGDLDVLHGARGIMAEDRPIALAEMSDGRISDLCDFAHQLDYRVGGFAAAPDGVRALPFRLLERDEALAADVKMWFLIPREREAECR